jgi:hypothetical protein
LREALASVADVEDMLDRALSVNAQLRAENATWRDLAAEIAVHLDSAEAELRLATGASVDFPASSHIAKALQNVMEAQSKLRPTAPR